MFSGPDMTHFLSQFGGGSMFRGIVFLVLVGAGIAIVCHHLVTNEKRHHRLPA
jgi:hypothetical protein